jgi:hypothetical protein
MSYANLLEQFTVVLHLYGLRWWLVRGRCRLVLSRQLAVLLFPIFLVTVDDCYVSIVPI